MPATATKTKTSTKNINCTAFTLVKDPNDPKLQIAVKIEITDGKISNLTYGQSNAPQFLWPQIIDSMARIKPAEFPG